MAKLSTPAPPNFQDFFFSRDGFDLGSAKKVGDSMQTQANRTDEQKFLNKSFFDLFQNAYPQLLQTSPEREAQIREQGKAVFDEIINPLRDQRDASRLATRENFNTRGILDSTSFEDYKRKNIDQLYNRGVLDAGVKSILTREDLVNSDQNRILGLLNFAKGGLDTDFNQGLSLAQYLNNGVTTANNIASQRFQDALAAASFSAQQQAMKQAQKKSGGGFWSSLGKSALGNFANSFSSGLSSGILGAIF